MNNSLPPALCSADAFSNPSIPNIEIPSIHAAQVSNVSKYIPEWYYYNHGNVMAQNLDFCNITVTYKHTAKNDIVNVGIFLPSNSWNGRMQGLGGNGNTAGLTATTTYGMMAAAAYPCAAVTTDGVHTSDSPAVWALLADGTLDYETIIILASSL